MSSGGALYLTFLSLLLGPMISLVVKHCTYFWTLILGDSLIAFALWLMSGISREDQGQATRTLVMYELISKWDLTG